MNSKTTTASIVVLAVLIALPVFADHDAAGVELGAGAHARVASTTLKVGAKAEANLETRMAKGKERATQEIDRRIKKLTDLNARVQGMARVSATTKAAIQADVDAEIASLNALKAKIAADTDMETLKADIKSIGQSYRIFMLIIPQGHVIVAADKVHTAAVSLTTLNGKLDARIADAQASGSDVSALVTLSTDMKAKVADAKVQADAAVALVANLTPDGGDKAKMDANNQALKDARAKLKVANDDLKKAREDARSILKGLKGLNAAATTTTP